MQGMNQPPGGPYWRPLPPPMPRPLPPPGWHPPPMGATTPPWLQRTYPPPRKSNTGAIVATLVVVALVVAAGLIGVLAVGGKKHHVADTGYDYPAAEPSTSDYTRTTTRRTTTTTRTTRTTTTTTTTTTAPTRTSTAPAGPQPVHALGDNPLFGGDVGTASVTCALARWRTDPQSAAAFFASALPCLEAAWVPVLQRAGLPYSSPSLEVPAGSTVTSPCTGSEGRSFAAFYCPRNHTIYLPFGALQTDLYGAHPGVYLAVMAHEFGHHVQAMAGVEDAYWDARYDAGADTEAGLDLSRRLELQAQCFSGMFLAAAYPRGSVDGNLLQEARTSEDRGDHTAGQPRDHGSDAHAIGWWEQGAQKNRTYQCNTWAANATDVA
jgi:predicted metalloprotease